LQLNNNGFSIFKDKKVFEYQIFYEVMMKSAHAVLLCLFLFSNTELLEEYK